jgi:hypothetical protein
MLEIVRFESFRLGEEGRFESFKSHGEEVGGSSES